MSRAGSTQERVKDDYYATPVWIIKKFLKWAKSDNHLELFNNRPIEILDPCAGGSFEYPIMPYLEGLKAVFKNDKFCYNYTSNDIRRTSLAKYQFDFLTAKSSFFNKPNLFDIVISNPPYLLATEFIKKGLEMVRPDGYVIYLLRLNFFGSKSRHKFWQNNMAEWCAISSKRPSFCKTCKYCNYKFNSIAITCPHCMKKLMRGTDATEYATFVWKKGYNPEYCKTVVI